jgi:hypothetical protein
MNLDFFGVYLPPIGNNLKNNQFILKHATRKENINSASDQILEEVCGDELKDLKEKMDYNKNRKLFRMQTNKNKIR